jgi:hypothetical protein
MLNEIKDEMENVMRSFTGSVGLFLSGGSDSLLLLYILLELQQEFSVVVFDHSFTREQKKHLAKIIAEKDLTVLSYPPMNAYLIGDGDRKVSIVEEYRMLDGAVIPFVRDADHTEKVCAMEDVKFGPFTTAAPVGFKLNIFGLRRTDRHYATGWVGRMKMSRPATAFYYNPLWSLTRKDVREGLKHYGAQYPRIDTGVLPMCLNCLCAKGEKVHCPKYQTEIPVHNWNPKENLSLFQEKFNYRS